MLNNNTNVTKILEILYTGVFTTFYRIGIGKVLLLGSEAILQFSQPSGFENMG